jgi:hypothetical protein
VNRYPDANPHDTHDFPYGTPAEMLDAILTDVADDMVDDLQLLSFDDDEVGARLDSFVFEEETAERQHQIIQAVMAEAEMRLADDPVAECQGHPAGPYDPMGETVYCDGTCR